MRNRGAVALLVAVVGVTVLRVAGAATCGSAPPMPPLRFAAQQVIDPVRAGGEPVVAALPDGSLLNASHTGATHLYKQNMPDPEFVTPLTGALYLWRSDDGGATWRYVGLGGGDAGPHGETPGEAVGYSDPTLAVDAAGNAYLAGIGFPANLYVARSGDAGRTWKSNPIAAFMTDREWLAADEDGVVYLVGNEVARGRMLWKSTDGAQTWNYVTGFELPGSGAPSPIAVDPSDGRLYALADHQSGSFAVSRLAIYPNARLNDYTVEDAEIFPAIQHRYGFVNAIAIDAAGNVYIVSNTATQVSVAFSSDRGRTWGRSVVGSGPTVLWPWISAGDDGRVGVSWFQADRPGHPATTVARWRVHAAQTVTGHGWVDSCGEQRAPVWQTALATPAPIHDGTICDQGLNCQVTLNYDRRLGDYHTNAITPDGRFVIAYAETASDPGGAISHPGFVRQTDGVDFRE